jgi:ABC-type multidrug transport system ATPase subunit
MYLPLLVLKTSIIMISVNNLSFSFGKQMVFENLSLTISEEEITTISGKNGVGKSTLLKILVGFFSYTEGEIFFDKVMSSTPYDNFGLLLSSPNIYPMLTVVENIKLKSIMLGLNGGRGRQVSGKYFEKFGLTQYKDQHAHELSKGNQMKLALYMSILNEPLYIFLDEPTTNLDTEVTVELAHLLKELKTELRTTIVLTSHDSNFIELLNGDVINLNKTKTF